MPMMQQQQQVAISQQDIDSLQEAVRSALCSFLHCLH
jgi:hypothetical protein